MKIKYREIRMSPANKQRLATINSIIEDYQRQGYVLTLRQLYYQLVSRDVIPNIAAEYDKLGKLLKEGRMAGIVDWGAIEDRLRKPSKPSSWNTPEDILNSCIYQYAKPRQQGQKVYVEVWVEKDALSGVLKRVTEKYHIPLLVNRGYSSASAMFDSYQRFKIAHESNQEIKILYLGDFDPSGMDMIRDVRDRIQEFIDGDEDNAQEQTEEFIFSVTPIALTKEQIDLYNPPPNPAKMADSRAKDFVKRHGVMSWEVDALPPQILNDLLNNAILSSIDFDIYEAMVEEEEEDKEKLRSLINYL